MDERELKEKCRAQFHCRCVMCGMWTDVVHEIIPRANGQIAFQLDNMVTLCNLHHSWAHVVGSKASAPILRKARERVLNAYSSG